MQFPALVALYEGPFATATYLGNLDCLSFSYDSNQFGGLGAGKFSLAYHIEDSTADNLSALNRLDLYVYRDTATASLTAGTHTINVHDGTRFVANQLLAIWDGVHHDYVVLSSVSGNALTVATGLGSSYSLGATVMVMRYRGRITTVERTADLDYHIDVTTAGYVQEIADFVVDNGTQIVQKEVGWVIYSLLNMYASELDLVINSSNFVMTTDSTGAVNGTGTNVGYSTTSGQRSLLDVISEAAGVANGNPSNVANAGNPANHSYTLWVDEHNVVHFGLLPSTTTVTLHLTPQTNVLDGVIDIPSSHIVHDSDATNMVNTYKLVGGSPSSSTDPVTAIVFDQTSVDTYGQIEAEINVPFIMDVATLSAFGQAHLAQTAYPVTSYSTALSSTRSFITGQDYVTVTGYTDGSSDAFSINSVTTSWTAGADVAQTIEGAQLLPNITALMQQIAGQHYIANSGLLGPSTNLTDRYVQSGLIGSINTNHVEVDVTAGIFQANVLSSGTAILTEFDISAFSFTPASDGVWSISYLYRTNTGTLSASAGMVTYPSATATGLSYTNFNVAPLYSLTRLGGVVTGLTFVGNNGGIGTSNVVAGSITVGKLAANPNPTTAPAFASGYTFSSVTAALTEYAPPLSGTSGSYDALATFGLTTANPFWLGDVRYYAIPSGATWTKNEGLKGALAPNASGVYTAVFDGLNAGATYDLYVSFLDLASNETPALKIATTNANAMIVGTINQAAMPQPTTPNIALSSAYLSAPYSSKPVIYGSGSSTYDAQLPYFSDGVGTSSTFWLFEHQLVATISGQTKWQQVGTAAPVAPSNTSDGTGVGEYVGVWAGLGANNSYDLGVRYLDHSGKFSNVTTLVTFLDVSLAASSLPARPSGTTVSAVLSGSLSYSGVGSANYQVSGAVKITISDTNWANWLSEIHVLARQIPGTSSDGDTNPTDFYDLFTIPAKAYTGSTTAVNFTIPLGASTNDYEITVQAYDNQGNTMTAAPFAVATAQQISAPGTITGGGSTSKNLIAGSDFKAPLGAYWTGVGTAAPVVNVSYAGFGSGGTIATSEAELESGSAITGGRWQTVGVQASTTFCLSAYGFATSGTAKLALYPASQFGLSSPTGAYGSVSLGAATTSAGRPQGAIAIPSGVSQAALFISWTSAVFAVAEPQLEFGSTFTGYTTGTAQTSSGLQAHLASSAATQNAIDTAGTVNPTTLNPAYGAAPHGAMSTAVQGVISSGIQVNVNPSGGVTGSLPIANHDPGVYVDFSGTQGGSPNIIPDSEFRYGLNTGTNPGYWNGLSLSMTGVHGRTLVIASPTNGTTYSATNVVILTNTSPGPFVYVTAGNAYTLSWSGNPGTAFTSGGYIALILLSVQSNAEIGRTTITSAGVGSYTRVSNSMTIPSGTSSAYIIAQYAGTASQSGSISVGRIQLETGTIATAYEVGDTDIVNGYLPRGGHHPDVTGTINGGGGIDFSSTLHINKNIDQISDGSTYLRMPATNMQFSRALIDYNNSNHINTLRRDKTDSSITNAITSAGVLANSSVISNLIANSTGFTTDITLHVDTSGGSGFGVAFWIDNGTGSTAPKLYFPSAPGSPTALVSYGNAGSPIGVTGGLSTVSSDTLFVMASYNIGSTAGVVNVYASNSLSTSQSTSNGWSVYIQKNAAFSASLAAVLLADGFAMQFTPASGGTFKGALSGQGKTGGGTIGRINQ